MDRIRGLKEYVKCESYLNALEIPQNADIEYKMFAQGEYNINYAFIHPITGAKLLFRVNSESQMNLKNQIDYEYQTLVNLKESGRTPMPIYVDGSLKHLNHGVLVMNYLDGFYLDYSSDLKLAAECLADIHSINVTDESHLIAPENPLQAVLDECHQMIQTYYESPLGDLNKMKQIERMLRMGQNKLEHFGKYTGYRCCVNTELNSTNFLINGKNGQNYLVDWEKPLRSDPAQDLGHFLAPTTTYWKTDVILNDEEMSTFVKHYKKSVHGRFEVEDLDARVDLYIPINCLRGITWCAMIWCEYQHPEKLIWNESTYRKLEAYLDQGFLNRIEKQYLS